MRSDVSRTMFLATMVSPSSLFRATPGTLRSACPAAPRIAEGEAWWSQTGSNRRPHACKARALPAELWPRTRRRMLHVDIRERRYQRRMRSIKVVGLGRLELPTSRLSSARSNQLSYKPQTTNVHQRIGARSRATDLRRMRRTSESPWRVFVREERETKTAKSRQWSSTIWRSLAPDVSKEVR